MPRDRRPTNARRKNLRIASGLDLHNGGGPAQGGIRLFFDSNLLHADYLA